MIHKRDINGNTELVLIQFQEHQYFMQMELESMALKTGNTDNGLTFY